MSQKHLVCQGATCQCQFGNAPDKLKVLTQTKAFINEEEPQEKLVATTADINATFEKNTFGLCKLQPIGNSFKPCQAIVTQWSGAYENVTYEENNGHPLLEDSKATCPIGGKDCISIINHGQVAEITNRNLHSADPIKMDMINPFMDFGKFVNDSIASSVSKKITDISWKYGENNTTIQGKSRFYTDIDLVVKTVNYFEGEEVTVSFKSEDGNPIVNDLSELTFKGVVDENGVAVIEKPLREYTLIIK